MTLKHLFGFRGGGGLALKKCQAWDVWARYDLKGDSSCLFNSFSLSRIGLVPRNAVMVAIDMCRKSLREWIYGVILLFLIIM